MDKERFEEIKKEFKWAVKQGHAMTLSHSSIDWLFSTVEEQQKEIEKLRRIKNTAIEQIDVTQNRNERLEKENERYEKVMKQIQNYQIDDVDYIPIHILYEIQLLIKKTLES